MEELSYCVGRSEVERCTGGGSDEVVISPSLLVSEYCTVLCINAVYFTYSSIYIKYTHSLYECSTITCYFLSATGGGG